MSAFRSLGTSGAVLAFGAASPAQPITSLSGGNQQKVVLAKWLMGSPDILILDEATASIDTETEQIIQDALKAIMVDRTSILIAHRLQTIQEADRILVLKDGRVKELGSHSELMAEKGVYYTLNQLQFQDVSLKPDAS